MPDTVDDVGLQRQELLDARYDPVQVVEGASGEDTILEVAHHVRTPLLRLPDEMLPLRPQIIQKCNGICTGTAQN